MGFAIVVSVVGSVYLMTVGILVLLSRIAPIDATVRAVLSNQRGKIWITAAGLLAAFVIISVIALVTVYVFVKEFFPQESARLAVRLIQIFSELAGVSEDNL